MNKGSFVIILLLAASLFLDSCSTRNVYQDEIGTAEAVVTVDEAKMGENIQMESYTGNRMMIHGEQIRNGGTEE